MHLPWMQSNCWFIKLYTLCLVCNKYRDTLLVCQTIKWMIFEFHRTRMERMEKQQTPWPCSSNGSQNKATTKDFVMPREMTVRRRKTYVCIYCFHDQQEGQGGGGGGGVRKPCTCKQVQLKTEDIEQMFQSVQWDTHTGQGIEEDDPNSFCVAVEKRCQNYFDLLDTFI